MARLMKRLFGPSKSPNVHPLDSEGYAAGGMFPRTAEVANAPRAGKKRLAPSFPSFLASAIGRAAGGGERHDVVRARMALRDIFAPSQPVVSRDFFAGRLDVLGDLIDMIEGQRSHVVIYGERGIGKTSLLHVLAEVARESHYIVVYDSCGAHSDFDEMFRGILQGIPLLYHSSVSPTSAEAEHGRTLADLLPPGRLDARRLGELCGQIVGTRVVIMLDEYDRVEDPEFRRGVAELVKNLSDRAARVQLVISGVAPNLDELIGYIPSIRRNVIGLPMPRLRPEEIKALINLGEQSAGVRFADDTVEEITYLSNGSPYLTRLLAHHISDVALDAGRLEMTRDDVAPAIERVISETKSRTGRRSIEVADRLVATTDVTSLSAIARAAGTADGWFGEGDVSAQLASAPSGLASAALERLVQMDVLQTSTEGAETRYRFRDDSLPILLHMTTTRVRPGG